MKSPHGFAAMFIGFLAGTLCLTNAVVQAEPVKEEIQFTATAGERIWEPNVVMIDQGETYAGLDFVLENPTALKHGFIVPGIFQVVTKTRTQKAGNGGQVDAEIMVHETKPLAVTVEPGETKRVRISTANLRSLDALGRQFKFFCPIHNDALDGGSIHVVG